MYMLNLADVPKFDLAQSNRFVDFWNQFYGYEVTDTKGQPINYIAELNIGNDLSEENVRRLLRWKDYVRLTDPYKNGKPNPKVRKVLAKLSALNDFRNGKAAEQDMQREAEHVFESGIVWRVFLLHIAKPHLYPIADQNVFRVYSLHTGRQEPQTWEEYSAYNTYFGEIARAMGVGRTLENLSELKRIDSSLFVFGQFLRTYYVNEQQQVPKATTAASQAN